MHQRAQGHTGTGWRLPLTATVNFQHNQFMCSSIITICVLHEEDSPEERTVLAAPPLHGRRQEQKGGEGSEGVGKRGSKELMK